jgi:hypothetical protein
MAGVEDFMKHLGSAPDGDSAAPGAEPDGDEAGMSPGDQALAAIKSGDGAALEAAILACMDKAKGPQPY